MQQLSAVVRDAGRAVRALILLSILVPISIFGIAAWTSYDRQFEDARERLQLTVELVREHAVKVFETHRLVAQHVDEILYPLTDEQIRDQEAILHPRLKQLAGSLAQIEDIWVLDRDGRPLITAYLTPAPRDLDLSDRLYYRVHLDGKAERDRPYVSEVLSGRFREGTFFQLSTSRSINGEFAGVTAISVQPRYFRDFYENVAKNGLSSIGLVHENGAILSRFPGRIENLVALPRVVNFVEKIKEAPNRGIYEGVSAVDGVTRIIAYLRVPGLPVYVSAAVDRSVVISAWRSSTISWLALLIPITLGLLGLSLIALNFTRKEARALARLRLESALREQREEQVRQLQKVEAIGQLTGGIAHDFNNLLTIVLGSLEMIKRRLARGDTDIQRFIDAATEGAERAAKLTSRLLAFARKQPLEPQSIDVNKLVAGMGDLLRATLGEQVLLEIVISARLWHANIDANQLENAIINLVVNARDAMPGGGRVTVETANAYLDENYTVKEPGLPPGQYVLICVTDNGLGMTPDVIAKAIDPFFTTKPAGQGTGLGLSQVYGFVKQSGGHLKIYSEFGQGTTIKIYLPRHIGEKKLVPLVDSPPAQSQRGTETILLVEDEDAVRRFSKAALEDLGYTVLDADCGTAALAILEARSDIALLFTDIVMPEMTGKELAVAAQTRWPHLKVLFTTGYSRNAIIHNGIIDPGVIVVGKPFTVDQLAAKVRQALSGLSADNSNVAPAGRDAAES